MRITDFGKKTGLFGEPLYLLIYNCAKKPLFISICKKTVKKQRGFLWIDTDCTQFAACTFLLFYFSRSLTQC